MMFYKVIRACIAQKINPIEYYFPTKKCIVPMRDLHIYPVKCPMCGKWTFDSWHICRNCGWEYGVYDEDEITNDYRDYYLGRISQAEYEERWWTDNSN